MRTKSLQDIPWLGSGDFRSNLYDFCLKAVEKAGRPAILTACFSIIQAPSVLSVWKKNMKSSKSAAYIRRGWPLKAEGMVSIVIPSKDNPSVLSTCIHSVMEASTYRNFEIIVVDNGSSEKNRRRIELMLSLMTPECRFRYVYEPMEFNFSAMCNKGVGWRAANM